MLLFQYIAAYPSMIREASTLEKQGLGLYVTSGSKKVLYLCKPEITYSTVALYIPYPPGS